LTGGGGFTVTHPSTGNYLITHNFSSTSYSVTATGNSSTVGVDVSARSANTCNLRCTSYAGAATDITEINFTITRYA